MKNITKILRASVAAVVAILSLVSLKSCQEMASSAIEEAVEEVNQQCPFNVGNGLICDRVYVSGKSVVFSYLSEDSNVIDGIDILGSTATDLVFEELQSLARVDDNLKTMIELCVEAEYNITYTYSDYSGRSASVTITHSELSLI